MSTTHEQVMADYAKFMGKGNGHTLSTEALESRMRLQAWTGIGEMMGVIWATQPSLVNEFSLFGSVVAGIEGTS